ncbi:MAG: hypothetical protein J6Y18_04590 [Candidatus Methanomethylophilaceae archaeon]|nr:hypothetical protein [Candidatus Methanomethylophilaceae archaeon]
MPGSKYEREIRFIGKEVIRLTSLIEDIRNGKGSGDPEKDAAEIAEMEAKIAQYRARRKEIEDSYIACGLELPLESRNLNACVYRNGSSFEPTDNNYRLGVMIESEANAKAYVSSGADLPEDPADLTREMNLLSDRIGALERAAMEAELEENMGEKVRLDEEATRLRAQRSDIFNKIKSIKSQSAPAADPSRLEKLESETAALRSQMSAMRQDIGDLKMLLANIADRMGIDEY